MDSHELPEFNAGGFVNSLAQTLAAANGYLVSQLAAVGLRDLVPSHGDILLQLFRHEDITMQELSERIHRDPSTVTTLVKKLVDAGYVKTRKSPEDKRRTQVSLTKLGQSLRKDFDLISKNMVEVQMQGIDERSFEIACDTLMRIRMNFLQASSSENRESAERER